MREFVASSDCVRSTQKPIDHRIYAPKPIIACEYRAEAVLEAENIQA
jgi:hypothetical protein